MATPQDGEKVLLEVDHIEVHNDGSTEIILSDGSLLSLSIYEVNDLIEQLSWASSSASSAPSADKPVKG